MADFTGTPGDDSIVGTSGNDTIDALAGNDAVSGLGGDDTIDGGDGDDGLRGNGGNDILLGGNGDDFLNGGPGDDTIDGGAGYDRAAYFTGATSGVTVDLNLQGTPQDTGQGMDTLIGIENVSGTSFDDILTGDGNANVLWGSPAALGDGTISAANNDTLDGGGGDDLLIVGIGDHSLTGGTGNDTVSFTENGGTEPDLTISLELQGAAQATGAGSWTLDGIENLSGGLANDQLTGDASANVLAGNSGDDHLVGGAGDDALYGDGQINWDTHGTGGSGPITTFPDVASLGGVDGNDILEGGAGDDYLNGGGGSDTASYANAAGPVDVELAFGYAAEYDSDGLTWLSTDTLVSIENAIGSSFGDFLVGSEGDNVLDGRGGDDFIQGRGGNDTLYGGDGNDTLQGDRGDLFTGLSGNDALYGEAGNDVLRGGLGEDQLFGGDGNDLMRGNAGVDSFDGGADDGEGFNGIGDRVSFYEQRATQGAVADLRDGTISNDGYGNVETMVGIESLGGGTAYADTFYGNDARNFLFGDLGDHIYGFGGDDLFQMSSAAATLDGGTGNDSVLLLTSGGALTPDTNADGLAEVMGAATEGWFVNLLNGTMFDGYGNFGAITGIENVTGSELADTIRGDNNNNVLLGAGGDDTVIGNGGDDIVDGGDGNDILRGDAATYAGGPFGNDTIIGGAGDDLMRGSAGVDSYDGGSDSGGISIYGGFGDRISFYEIAATSGVIADLRDGTISNDGFGNAETMTGIESLGGDTAYVDTFYGNDSSNTLLGGRGDNLYGFGGDDQFSLSVAAGIVDGGGGVDVLQLNDVGGWLMPDANSDGLAEAAASSGAGWSVDLAAGTMVDGYGNAGVVTGIENIDGSENSDTLVGDDNANIINGGDGNDTLVGGAGNDTLIGGAGNDTVSYWTSDRAVGVDLQFDVAYEYASDGLSWTTDTLSSIENAIGSQFNDGLFGSTGNNYLDGADGNDIIRGRGGNDQIFGGAGNDDISGDFGTGVFTGGGDDSLDGGEGNDVVRGRDGNDIVLGGAGNDFVEGGTGDDFIDGGDGYDRAAYFSMATTGVHVDLNLQGVAQDTGQGMDTLINIEDVSGTAFDDVLIGDGNDNWLRSGVGTDSDTFVGNGGNDLIEVGGGNHTLSGDGGNDTWSLIGNTTDITSAGVTVSLALQGAAQDTEQGMMTATGFENLSGSIYDDNLTGDGGNNVLAGDQGNDNLVGGAGNDTLYGDGRTWIDFGGTGTSGPITTWSDVTLVDPTLVDGNDTLEGGAGDDQLYGGGGNDTASYANAGGDVQAFLYNGTFGEAFGADGYDQLHDIENLTGGAFNDQLFGNNQANVLAGGDGHDSLRGNAGNDTLLGGTGDDFLNGGQGDDTIDGGAGFDRAAFYTGATSGVTINLNIVGPQNTGQGMDTLIGIENVSGTVFADTLIGDGNDNALWGSPATLGDGSISAANNDTLDGGGGNDLLTVGIGNHSLTGGSGNDTVSFTENGNPEPGITVSLAIAGAQATGAGTWTLNGIDNLSGGIANDTLTGDGNANVLAGDAGNDTLVGGGGNDVLYGDGRITTDSHGIGTSGPITTFADVITVDPTLADGNDTLDGGAGDDILNGGGGNDTATYANTIGGGVNVNLALGTATGAAGNDTLISIENVIGSSSGDSIFGDTNANRLEGGNGNDRLISGDGNDLLYGGNGNDILKGQMGDDLFDGGAGIDIAKYYQPDAALGGVTVSLLLQGSAQYVGSEGWDTLVSIENIYGTPFADTITGDDGDNWLLGSEATIEGIGVSATNNDVIDGRGGNDLITVGLGNHTLTGGSGTDTLWFTEFGFPEVGLTIDLNLGVSQITGAGSWTLSGFENLVGGQLNDVLTGDGGANLLAGDSGNDTLIGGAGDDQLYGDGALTFANNVLVAGISDAAAPGNDTLEGGLGNDTLNGGGGIDTATYAHASGGVSVDLGAGSASGADGNDTLTSIENVTGSAFNDSIFGDGGNNLITGGNGDDRILGGAGNDNLLAGNGNDIIKGQAGDDVIDGGAGIDRAGYWQPDSALGGVTVSLLLQGTAQNTGSQGWDTLNGIEHVFGTPFADNLTGDGGNNWLSGSEATLSVGNVSATNNDYLDGQGGNDLLSVGIGNHTVLGGTGNDTLWFTENGFPETGITVSLALQGAAQATGNGSWNLSGIENLTGGTANDILTGDGNANVLGGGAGNDTLVGGGGNDTLYGDGGIAVDGNGVIMPFTDVAAIALSGIGTDVAMLPGASGNDTLEGGLGNDTLNGGGGNDTATYAHASGSVTVNLIAGTATGADGSDTLASIENVTGSAFADTITGGANANLLDGGNGNDTLDGRAGNDTLIGGGGIDTATYANASGAVTVNLTLGTASGADGSDTLATIENVTGSSFADTITGDANANTLNGGDGDDTLNGRLGNDTLNGGNGIDTASYANASGAVSVNLSTGSATGADGTDTLTLVENVTGSAFADTLRGDDFANVLSGGAGIDALLGGKGNDSLYGGTGDDTMTGGQANDRFVIEANSGSDTVVDFLIGTDKIVFDASSGITSMSQLTITRVGSDARVSWAGGNSVLLQGVRASSLTASDFQFGSAAFAAAEFTTLSTSGALTGAIAASGLAAISSSDPAFSTNSVEGLSTTGGAMHDQAFAPETLGFANPSSSSFMGTQSAQLFDSTLTNLTGFREDDAGSSSSVFHASFTGSAALQPTDLLQATAPTSQGPAASSFGMAATGIAIPSAEQLAALGGGGGPVEGVQHNQIVSQVLADAIIGGEAHGPNVDMLLSSLPGSGGLHAGDALASHFGGPVGLADMGGFHGIGGDSAVSVMLIHPDAVAPA